MEMVPTASGASRTYVTGWPYTPDWLQAHGPKKGIKYSNYHRFRGFENTSKLIIIFVWYGYLFIE